MNKIYKATFTCTNPSADCYGFFSTKDKAKEALNKKMNDVLKDIQKSKEGDRYYADSIKECYFDIEEEYLDTELN